MYTTITPKVHHIYTTHVHHMYTIYILHVHHMNITCTSYVHNIYTICTPHEHHMFTTCTLHVPLMYPSDTLHIHLIYKTCTSHVLYTKCMPLVYKWYIFCFVILDILSVILILSWHYWFLYVWRSHYSLYIISAHAAVYGCCSTLLFWNMGRYTFYILFVHNFPLLPV